MAGTKRAYLSIRPDRREMRTQIRPRGRCRAPQSRLSRDGAASVAARGDRAKAVGRCWVESQPKGRAEG